MHQRFQHVSRPLNFLYNYYNTLHMRGTPRAEESKFKANASRKKIAEL